MSGRLAAVGLAVVLATGAAACTSEPKDPAEQRKERVQARIEDTFSRTQAACIMDVLDAPTIAALDKEAALPADSEPLRIYSNAVVACTA
jgi:hypothetical protein